MSDDKHDLYTPEQLERLYRVKSETFGALYGGNASDYEYAVKRREAVRREIEAERETFRGTEPKAVFIDKLESIAVLHGLNAAVVASLVGNSMYMGPPLTGDELRAAAELEYFRPYKDGGSKRRDTKPNRFEKRRAKAKAARQARKANRK